LTEQRDTGDRSYWTEMDNQIQRICQLLTWTPEAYCLHQYTEYELCIARICQRLPGAARLLRYSTPFRIFYNNEWAWRNENEFIPFANSLTEDLLDIDEEGVSIYKGMEYGTPLLIEEYCSTHAAQQLFYNEEFTTKYCQIVDHLLAYV